LSDRFRGQAEELSHASGVEHKFAASLKVLDGRLEDSFVLDGSHASFSFSWQMPLF
jgi:hypothetical protein